MSSPELITASVSDPQVSAEPQLFQPRREIRFAVVMYGGVSLAIYINGVAQELLNMVRATATVPTPETKDNEDKVWQPLVRDKLPGAIGVYRKLGQYLKITDKKQRQDELLQESISKTDPIRTHFVVDVISGTSAGGINGVFLAKALARDQDMKGLKQLWLNEGDLGKLLNDKSSMDGVRGFKLKRPQESLLNSQRMYYKLLEALDQMDDANKRRPESEDSPLVGELDLFITTTDIDGIPLPIDLFDDVVYERRHKNVFHFRYTTEESTGTKSDDFIKTNDPFLAFAARCTSSFPFAFESMRLCDITDIAKAYLAHPPYTDKSITTSAWDKFFSDYMRNSLFDLDLEARGLDATGKLPGTGSAKEKLAEAEKDLRESFRKRSFGDGGYLDNKPFSYATSMLTRRYADCAVDRKLLYVEPSPEHPELTRQQVDPPDFAQNVRAAALDLPRQETIREDMDRVYERNALLERIAILATDVDADLRVKGIKPLTGDEFQEKDLDATISHYGVTYGAYHRLRISEVTTLLAELVARAAGYDPSSDATVAIRELVKAWRRAFYHPKRPRVPLSADQTDPNGQAKQTENKFLLEFDIQYDVRRQAFLNRRINQLIELDDEAKVFLQALTTTDEWPSNVMVDEIAGTEREAFQKELNRIKREEVALVLKNARSAEEKLLDRSSPIGNELYTAIDKLKIGWPQLEDILKCDSGVQRETKAGKILLDPNFQRTVALSDLSKIIARGLGAKRTSRPPEPGTSAKGALAARASIKHYRKNFILYDLVVYPIQYGTGAGESSVVDVFRISPEDAKTLMKEPPDKKKGAKLAGRTLMSFGAFLDESWRRNDMLWGRLDGAERIIAALLPNKEDEDLRKKLIQEAHRGILTEEIEAERNFEAVSRVLSNALANRATQDDKGTEVSAFSDSIRDKYWDHWTPAQRESLTVGQHLNRDLPPKQALEYISRSTNITGKMLEGLADQHRFDAGKRAASWVTRLGATLWNMIAVAVPQSLGNIFFRHWLGLLYLFSAVIILVGIAFNSGSSLGWQLLGATVSLNVVTLLLGDFIAGKHRWLQVARQFGILLVAILIGFGVYFVSDRSLKFLAADGRASIIGVITGFVVLVLLGYLEWRHWLKNFLRAPTTNFNYRTLGALTLATLLLIIALMVIGPVDMRGFEFSKTASVADPFKARVGIDRLRIQLAVDFALIVAYASMLASYCVAGAKLFWQLRETLARKYQQDREAARAQALKKENNSKANDQKSSGDQGAWPLKLLWILVVVGFAVAGLQWLAAIADVSENVGLLLYLKEKPLPDFNGLELAYWSATVKFWLIAAGATYAAIALSFGAWKKSGERPITLKRTEIGLRVLFIAVSLAYFGFSVCALFVCRPSPQQCSPLLLPEIWTRLFH